MLDEKDEGVSTNSKSDLDLQIPKLAFTPLVCSSPRNMAKSLTKDLEFNDEDHTEPPVLPMAEIPETIIGQLDIAEWTMKNSSFEYFTLPDIQMPKLRNEEQINFKQTNLIESNQNAYHFNFHNGFGLFQRIMNGIWNLRPSFIEANRKRTRAEEIPYIEKKMFLSSISKTFKQEFPKSLLDVLCNLEISVNTQTSDRNSTSSMTNSDLYIKDSQNIETNEQILDPGLDNDSHITFLLNQHFKVDTMKYNPLLAIDEDVAKIYKNKQNVDYWTLSNGANVEPRIADYKKKQMVIENITSQEIADPIDIRNSGKQVFNKHVELFYVENFKDWKRYGEGKIQIWQTHGLVLSYYVLLWDSMSNELLIHTKLDVDWKIEYMDKSSDTCHWMMYNYANSPSGKLERLSYRFPDSDTAAKFVLFVDKCVDKLLLV